MKSFLDDAYESEPWKIRIDAESEKVRPLIRPILFTLGYSATSTTDPLNLSFTPKSEERDPTEGVPDQVNCVISPAADGNTEVRLSSLLELDTFLELLKERLKFAGFTLAVAVVVSNREWSYTWHPGIFFGVLGLLALMILSYFVRFSLHSTRFDKREVELATKVGKRLEEKFPGSTLELPGPNARFFRPIAIALALDLLFYALLALILGTPPTMVLLATPAIFGLLITLVRTKQWHSRIYLLSVNYAISVTIALLYHVIPVPALLGREPLSSFVRRAEERIHQDEAVLANTSDLDTARRQQAAVEVREKKIILAIFRRAHVFTFGIVILVCGTWILLVPSLVQVRQLVFQRHEYPGKGFRVIAIVPWLILTASLVHAIWISQAIVVNLLAGRQVILGTVIEGTQADTLFLFEDLARDFGIPSPQRAAWWGALVFSSSLPLGYILWVVYPAFSRLRTYLRLVKADVTANVEHLLRENPIAAAIQRLRVCKSEAPGLHARALYFALTGARIIEVSEAALTDLSKDQLKALLVHEAHHLERDVVKLWWAALLSHLSLCGSGYFYILFDTHEMEYAADDGAVQAIGASRSAVIEYSKVLKKIERSYRLNRHLQGDPVGAFYACAEPGFRSRVRSFIEAFRILFGSNTPYVHPPREVRISRLMDKYQA